MNEMSLHNQWMTRPADERFASLPEMLAKLEAQRAITRASVVSSRAMRAVPHADHRGLAIVGPKGNEIAPTHWAFGQLASLDRGQDPRGSSVTRLQFHREQQS